MTDLFDHPKNYSPAHWPPEVGTLAIIREKEVASTNSLNGFVLVVCAADSSHAFGRLLDSTMIDMKCFPLDELIATGKTPDQLMEMFQPTSEEVSKALEVERSMPDFDAYPRRSSSTSTSAKKTPRGRKSAVQKINEMSPEQVAQLKSLLMQTLQAQGIELKGGTN